MRQQSEISESGRILKVPVTTHQVRVRYAETDQMGIVYYANYLVWFELGRVELLRSLGLAYSQLEKEHECILPVVEANCRYRSPARYDDEILIETRPAMLRGSVLNRFLAEIRDVTVQVVPMQKPLRRA